MTDPLDVSTVPVRGRPFTATAFASWANAGDVFAPGYFPNARSVFMRELDYALAARGLELAADTATRGTRIRARPRPPANP